VAAAALRATDTFLQRVHGWNLISRASTGVKPTRRHCSRLTPEPTSDSVKPALYACANFMPPHWASAKVKPLRRRSARDGKAPGPYL
jgi:hypothetical protein